MPLNHVAAELHNSVSLIAKELFPLAIAEHHNSVGYIYNLLGCATKSFAVLYSCVHQGNATRQKQSPISEEQGHSKSLDWNQESYTLSQDQDFDWYKLEDTWETLPLEINTQLTTHTLHIREILACEQALRGALAAGREKKGELATSTSPEVEFHFRFPCGSLSTELSDFHQSARSGKHVPRVMTSLLMSSPPIRISQQTFSMQIFKFQGRSCKLSFLFPPNVITSMTPARKGDKSKRKRVQSSPVPAAEIPLIKFYRGGVIGSRPW